MLNKRDHHKKDLTVRDFTVRSSSFDVEARSVEAVLATEARVKVLDLSRWEVIEEILLMKGARIPTQIPFLDTHQNQSIMHQLGSVRNLRIEGDKFIGTNVYASTPEGERAFKLARDGHLVTNSIGYQVIEFDLIDVGKSKTIHGRSFTAGQQTLRVVSVWEPKESSAVCIPADRNAINRKQLENRKMKFKEWLEKRGFNLDELSDDQKTAMRADFDLQTAGGGDEFARGTKAELERQTQIRTAGDGIDAEIVQRCIDENKTVDQAKAEFLEEIRGNRNVEVQASGIVVGDDHAVVGIDGAVVEVILSRAGVDLMEVGVDGYPVVDSDGSMKKIELSQQGRSMMNCRLPDLARRILIADGDPGAGDMSDRTAVREALKASRSGGFSTVSLSTVLGNTMGRSVLQSYQEYPVQWPKFGTVKQHPNFKEITRLTTSGIETVSRVPEGGEYGYATIGETKEVYQLLKYGVLFGITFEMIVNDNLNVFSEIPQKLGQAARRIEDVAAFAALQSGDAMNDGVVPFHADHGNLAGAGAVPSVITLNAAKLSFRKQKGVKGGSQDAYLNLTPKVLIVPCELEPTADILNGSTYDPVDLNSKIDNIWKGKLSPVTHPILGDTSTTAWYFGTGPGGGGLEVCFLQGQRHPYLEKEQAFDMDVVRWKIRHIVASKLIDHRQIYKNPGA